MSRKYEKLGLATAILLLTIGLVGTTFADVPTNCSYIWEGDGASTVGADTCSPGWIVRDFGTTHIFQHTVFDPGGTDHGVTYAQNNDNDLNDGGWAIRLREFTIPFDVEIRMRYTPNTYLDDFAIPLLYYDGCFQYYVVMTPDSMKIPLDPPTTFDVMPIVDQEFHVVRFVVDQIGEMELFLDGVGLGSYAARRSDGFEFLTPPNLPGMLTVYTPQFALGSVQVDYVKLNEGAEVASTQKDPDAGDCIVPGSTVVLCHVPPGNPGNVQTITIGARAAIAHLAHHLGDYLGECAENPTALSAEAGSGFGEDVRGLDRNNTPSATERNSVRGARVGSAPSKRGRKP